MTEDEGRYFREGYEQGKREGVATRFNTYDVQLKEYEARIAELEGEKRMTLIEAYRAGKPIKRKGWRDWYTLRDDRTLTGLRWYNELEGMVYGYITKLDLLSTDWMVRQDAKDIGREPE